MGEERARKIRMSRHAGQLEKSATRPQYHLCSRAGRPRTASSAGSVAAAHVELLTVKRLYWQKARAAPFLACPFCRKQPTLPESDEKRSKCTQRILAGQAEVHPFRAGRVFLRHPSLAGNTVLHRKAGNGSFECAGTAAVPPRFAACLLDNNIYNGASDAQPHQQQQLAASQRASEWHDSFRPMEYYTLNSS